MDTIFTLWREYTKLQDELIEAYTENTRKLSISETDALHENKDETYLKFSAAMDEACKVVEKGVTVTRVSNEVEKLPSDKDKELLRKIIDNSPTREEIEDIRNAFIQTE